MQTSGLELRDVIVFLIAAGFVVPLLHRFKVNPILGYLAIGIVIGPYGLARFAEAAPWIEHFVISDAQGVRALAELGVVFLLFMIGLELSPNRLWTMRNAVFGLGSAQVFTTGAAVTAIALAFDNPLPAAIVLGAAFALSSTAIVMELLIRNQRLNTNTGQTCFSVLLFQDLAVLPILLMVGALAAKEQGSIPLAFANALLQATAAIGAILATGHVIIRPLFRIVGAAASREMFLAATLLIVIGTAIVTEKAGLSMALGAFLAGLLFAETEYRHEISVDIEPFKGLLLGLFFVSIGMGIDPAQIVVEPAWLLASVAGLFVVKGSLFFLLARLAGKPNAVAIESALLLGQGGEFGFLIITQALAFGLLPQDTAQFMLIVTSLTMLATPLVAQSARRLAQFVEAREGDRKQQDARLPADIRNHVIIAGYGRVGQMLGSILEAQGISFIALDFDPLLVSRFRRKGSSVFFGDARQPRILRKVGIENAIALVVTMDSPAATEHVVRTARLHWPHLPIYARARDGAHAKRLFSHGATHVVPETIEASLQLSEMVLAASGVPEETARRLIEARRDAEQTALDESHRAEIE